MTDFIYRKTRGWYSGSIFFFLFFFSEQIRLDTLAFTWEQNDRWQYRVKKHGWLIFDSCIVQREIVPYCLVTFGRFEWQNPTQRFRVLLGLFSRPFETLVNRELERGVTYCLSLPVFLNVRMTNYCGDRVAQFHVFSLAWIYKQLCAVSL